MELDKYQKNYIVALSNCNYIIIPPHYSENVHYFICKYNII